ncbi:MAG: hypothetical protein H7301_03950 [Cryobacterium sp.]|nr:hypothetical protein [Oligoflexia bacterium]
MSESSSSVATELGPICAEELRALFKNGGNLESSELRSETRTVAEFDYPSGKKDSLFYLYTRSPELVELMSRPPEQRAKLQFSFLKNRANPTRVFYVAEDPLSSRSFGKYQIRVKLLDDTRILNFVTDEEKIAVMKEVNNAFSDQGVHSCGSNSFPSAASLLILQESGIAVVNYQDGTETGGHWFQILSDSAIESMDLGTPGTW